MTASCRLAVAPNFHLPGTVAQRLLGTDCPSADIVLPSPAREDAQSLVLLFVLPARLRSMFWETLEQAPGGSAGSFDAITAETAQFLAFKELPPPVRALFELVLQRPAAPFDGRGLWAVVNLSDDVVQLALPGLRLALAAGEGCRLPDGMTAESLSPSGDDPAMLLVVRRERK